MSQMTFWEKWYWANFVRGTNPITRFIWGLIVGIWIPLAALAIFCLLTGIPYFWFLGQIVSTFWDYLCHDIYYFSHNLSAIQKHVRWMLFD